LAEPSGKAERNIKHSWRNQAAKPSERLKFIAYDEEGNTQMDAADSRFDYLSSADSNGNDQLHGALIEVKSEK